LRFFAGGVQIDHVDERVGAEAVQQSKNIIHRELQFAAVDKLYGAAVLQVDTRNHHVCD
jgi:hypothetical protein